MRGIGGQRVVIRARRELIAEPLQAEPGALRDAHHVPFVAHRVAEGVDAAGGIVLHLLHVREDHAGSAQGAGNDARLDNAVAHRTRGLVAAAAYHWRSRSESRKLLRRASSDLAGDVARFVAFAPGQAHDDRVRVGAPEQNRQGGPAPYRPAPENFGLQGRGIEGVVGFPPYFSRAWKNTRVWS